MDTFKLLTRSSNIQKSGPASKKIKGPHIPSAGIASLKSHLGENGDFSNNHERQGHRGMKRKRSELQEHGGDNVPKQLDFFSSEARVAVSLGSANTKYGYASKEEQSGIQKATDTREQAPKLGEDECRQILKKHNVKVTILGENSETQASHECQSTKKKADKHGRKKDTHTQVWPQPLTSFQQLRSKYGVSRRLAANLEAQRYKMPTDVQLGSLPLLLGSDEDRGLGSENASQRKCKKHSRAEVDLLTVAPTGSGKTLGFMIHLLQELLKERQAKMQGHGEAGSAHQVQALIIAPTHELVDQIVNEGRKLASGIGIKISGLKKGLRLHSQLAELKDQVNADSREKHPPTGELLVKSDILVSTPLLLLHAISTTDSLPLPLPNVRFLVLDEADILLDPLFRSQTLVIWTACSNPSLRTSLWSATIGSSIESLAQSFILDRRSQLGLSRSSKDPQHHILRLVVGLKDSAIPNISHHLVYTASERGKLLALRQLLHPSAAPTPDTPSLQPPFLIFIQTIPRAIALHSELLYDIPIEAGGSSRIAVLHSDLSDSTRSNIMAGFRKGEIWILITTDLLSRGMDFRGINGVVNYDIPNTGASYVHRVGRTGRQGREGGVAVTLYTKEDIPYVKNVANVISASERAKGGNSGELKRDGQGVQKWLLDALPDVSKKTKKELKRRGVESRRANVEKEGGGEARKMRISTKSGYDRRLENRKKGTVSGSRRRVLQADEVERDVGGDDDEWGGIDDD